MREWLEPMGLREAIQRLPFPRRAQQQVAEITP
jgi:hypothetical protein